ncbi:MAG: hypothetical protein ACW99J_19145 [Candidatus Thorarchaeota archaeon]
MKVKLKTTLFILIMLLSPIPVVLADTELPAPLADELPTINTLSEDTTNQDEQTTVGNPVQPQQSLYMPDGVEAIIDVTDTINNCNDTAQGGSGTILSVNMTWDFYIAGTHSNDEFYLEYGVGTDCNAGAPGSWTRKATYTANSGNDGAHTNATFNITADRSWTWADLANVWIRVESDKTGSADPWNFYWDAGFFWVLRSYASNTAPTIDDKITGENWDEDAATVHRWNATDPDADTWTWTVEADPAASFLAIEYDDNPTISAWVNGSCRPEGSYEVWTNISDGTDSDSDQWTLTCNNLLPTISDKIVEEHWDEDSNVVHQWNSTDSDLDPHTWTVAGNASFMSIEYDNRTAWVNGSCEEEGYFNLWTNVTDGTATDNDAWVLYCDNVSPSISDPIVEENWNEDANVVHQWNSTDSDEDPHTWTVEGEVAYLTIDTQNRTAWANGSCEDEGSFSMWTNVTDGTDSDSDAWTLTCNNVAVSIDDKITEEHWLAGTAYVHQWNSTDADEDAHTWTAEGNHSFGALEYSNRTAWFNGTCTWAQIGYFNVWTNVTDGTASDNDAWVLYCDNNAPTIDDKIVQENWVVDTATSHQWNSSDTDSHAHTWTLAGNASFLSLEQDNRTAWANGTCLVAGENYNVWINVSDGTDTDSDDFVLYCVAGNTAPTIDDKITGENWNEDALVSHQWNATDPDADSWTWTVQADPTAAFLGIEYDGLSAWVNGSCRPEGSYEVWTNISDGTDTDSDQWTLTCNNQLPSIDDPITEEYWTVGMITEHQWNSSDSDEDSHTWSYYSNATFLTLEQDNRTGWLNGSCTSSDAGLSFSVWMNVTDGTDSDSDDWTLYCEEVAEEEDEDPGNPISPIKVFTKSEYDAWTNQLKVELIWTQRGGMETANVTEKHIVVFVDGEQITGFIPIGNVTYVELPWNFLDPGQHNITVFGYVTVGWTKGSWTYRSDPEHMMANNFPRSLLVYLSILLFVMILISVIAERAKKSAKLKH